MKTLKEKAVQWAAFKTKLSQCNYKYGHILICIAQGRITDQKALEERFDALELKVENFIKEMDDEVTVHFDRKIKPPKEIYFKEYPFAHNPYFPLKFAYKGVDVSEFFRIMEIENFKVSQEK